MAQANARFNWFASSCAPRIFSVVEMQRQASVPCSLSHFFISEPRSDFEVVCMYLPFFNCRVRCLLSGHIIVRGLFYFVCLVVYESAVSLCDYSYSISSLFLTCNRHHHRYRHPLFLLPSSSLLQLHFLSSTPLYTVRNSLGRFSFLHRQWRRPPLPLSPSPLHLLVPIPSFILRFFLQLIRLWLSADQGRD